MRIVSQPPVGKPRRARVSRLLWNAQLAAVFMLGGLALLRQLPAAWPPSGPWMTSDLWLQRLQLSRPSETVRSALDDVRAGAVLFVGRDDEPTTILTYYTVSYLIWPRPIGLCLVGSDGAKPRAIVGTGKAPVALMYYDVEPPSGDVRPLWLGSRLAVVEVSEPDARRPRCR
jgi:hypothetical protein